MPRAQCRRARPDAGEYGQRPVAQARERVPPRGLATLSGKLAEFVSAIHAYEVTEALTYVKEGKVLPQYQT